MNKTINDLGRKIVIVGISASGKSHFSHTLAAKLQIPLTLTDKIMHRPGWQNIGDDSVLKLLDEESAKDSWIIEGYLPKAARTMLFYRADSIIYFEFPPLVSTKHYLKHWLQHKPGEHAEALTPSKPLTALKSIWMKVEIRDLKPSLAEADQDKIIQLNSPEEVEAFIQNKPTLPEIEVATVAVQGTPPAETPKA